MSHSVRCTDFFSVVERCDAVSVGNNEDILGRENLQGSLQCSSNEFRRLVTRYQECRVGIILLDIFLGVVSNEGRVALEENKKRSEAVTA